MPEAPPEATKWLTPKQAAKRIGASPSTVIRLVDAGRLPGSINIGQGTQRRRGLRIPEASVLAYLSASQVASPGEVVA